MSRLTGTDVYGLMEAYTALYAPQELTEEQVWEGVETWINSLVEEGYDLSDYTWEEMYEAYFSEDIKKDSESAGGAFRRWSGARVREVGDIIGSGYKGIIGQETSSSNPLSRTSNALARGGTSPVRDVITPFVTGTIKNTKSEPKKPEVSKPTPRNQPQPDSGGKLGNWLAPPRGSSKSADPVVRGGGLYGFFGANKPPSVTKPTPPSQPPLNGVKRGPRGGIVLNQVEVDYDRQIVEAEAQVAPITGSAGKEWMQKGKDGKWYPITDLELAKKSKERWEKESKRQPQEPRSGRLDDPIAGKGPRGNEVGSPPKPIPAAPAGSPPPRPAAPVLSKKGGVEGTGVGANFKAKAFTDAERSRYTSVAAKNAAAKPAPASQLSPGGRASNADLEGKTFATGTTAGGTKFERRTPTSAEMQRSKAAGGGEAGVKAAVERSSKLMGGPGGPGEPKADPALKPITRSLSPTPTPKPAATPTPADPKPNLQQNIRATRGLPTIRSSYEYDAYDLVLEYLLSQGHVETLEEANYVMLVMDAETIGSIVEECENDLLSEEVTAWVNELVEDGYDLSEYTWEDLAEYYVNEANKAEKMLGLTSRQRERARNLNQYTDKPIFYGTNPNRRKKADNSDPILNKAHKGMTAKRKASHRAGRGTRGDSGESTNVVKSRYQANKDHEDGYPSITKRGQGPT
jgi:hypothetical protein